MGITHERGRSERVVCYTRTTYSARDTSILMTENIDRRRTDLNDPVRAVVR